MYSTPRNRTIENTAISLYQIPQEYNYYLKLIFETNVSIALSYLILFIPPFIKTNSKNTKEFDLYKKYINFRCRHCTIQ